MKSFLVRSPSLRAPWWIILGVLLLLGFDSCALKAPKKDNEVQIKVMPKEPPKPPKPPEETKKIEKLDQTLTDIPKETKVEEIPKNLTETPPDAAPEMTSNGPMAADGSGTIKAGSGGGRGVIGGGGNSVGTYNKYAKYLKQTEAELRDRLRKLVKLPKGSYEIVVRLIIQDDGTISSFRINETSGSKEFDDAVQLGLQKISKLSEPPPADAPRRPIIRINI